MIHVYPVDDWIEHKLEGTGCICEPRVDFSYGEGIVIHNSVDGRETRERRNNFGRSK